MGLVKYAAGSQAYLVKIMSHECEYTRSARPSHPDPITSAEQRNLFIPG
jgi:hypothetical protein